MNEEALNEMIDHWEPPGIECVRTIDTQEDTVERILKLGGEYSLCRYFTLSSDTAGIGDRVCVSVDLDRVDADRVIQHLAERL